MKAVIIGVAKLPVLEKLVTGLIGQDLESRFWRHKAPKRADTKEK